MSTTYAFEDAEQFAAASAEKVGAGYVYTRWANPTIDTFERAIADLEGAEDAEAFASGMAAISHVFLALCDRGDRVVVARQLYGGTHALVRDVLPRYGIHADAFDIADIERIAHACAGAKLLYCETIGNPRVVVADIAALAEAAAAAGIPLVVDNTFASPILCRPIEHGAAISLHSATKFLGGHHDLMGGVSCGSTEVLRPIKELARELGATMSPFNAWLALRGLQTLELRVERACASAVTVATALAGHQHVDAVYYPAMPQDGGHGLARSMLGGRGGGVVGFDVAGGRGRARRFQEHLRLVAPAASLGGTHSLLVHAASVTHTQLSDEELREAGISEGFCRLSVGLEDPDDLIADLERALSATR